MLTGNQTTLQSIRSSVFKQAVLVWLVGCLLVFFFKGELDGWLDEGNGEKSSSAEEAVTDDVLSHNKGSKPIRAFATRFVYFQNPDLS